jgi:DNA-binding transcriptional LysR family regulator
MHRRYDSTNIPIELLRSFVAIAELGSLTKAADRLKLTQPAVSAQIKRLQQIVGSMLLEKSGFGLQVSDEGEIVLRYARRLLALNDQILLHSTANPGIGHTRIGISTIFNVPLLTQILRELAQIGPVLDFQIECARSYDLAQRFSRGKLELAVIPLMHGIKQVPRASWSYKMVWVGAPATPVSPGSPIPLIGWSGSASEKVAIDALNRAGQPYKFNFVAEHWTVITAALNAGLGYLAMPEFLASAFKLSREYYLPPLSTVANGVFVREDGDERLDIVVRAIERVLNVPEKLSKLATG